MTPGTYEGEHYDGKMSNIHADHLALVEDGRAGSDVAVSDSNPFAKGDVMDKKAKILQALLSVLSPKAASDASLGDALKTLDRAKIKLAVAAMDADIPPQQVDNMLDAALGVEQDEPKPVESTAGDDATEIVDRLKAALKAAGKSDEEIEKLCSGAPAAHDEFPKKDDDEKMTKEDVKAAADAAVANYAASQTAKKEVEPVMGVYTANDDAATVYAAALDQMKVDRVGVTDPTALRAIFKVASTVKDAAPRRTMAATDSANLAAKFPGIARISVA